MTDGACQRRPVPFAFEADDPESPTVAGDVVVDRRIAHGLAGADRRW